MDVFDTDAAPTQPSKFGRATDRLARVDAAIFWLFLVALAWAPFWYGGNTLAVWGIDAILFPGLALAFEVSAVLPGRRHPVALNVVALPASLFAAVLVWVGLQTATWVPAALINPIWNMAADTLGRPLADSISVNRDLTGLALVRLTTAASAFWLAMQLSRDGARAGRLITVIAAIGAVYAAYGIVAARAGPIAWFGIRTSEGQVTSTFVNENSYATYAGIGLIATAGLLVRAYQRGAVEAGGWRLRAASLIDTSGREGAWLLGAGFVILVALLLTGSRGGVLAAGGGLATLFALALCHARGAQRHSAGAIGFLLGLIAVTLIAFGGIFARHLGGSGLADSNRAAVFATTARSVLDMPVLGFGYGTFADVFPLYRDHSISLQGAWLQAHDSYIEELQGLGVIAGGMLIAALALLALRCARGALRRQENAILPGVAAGTACLVGLHAAADFSLQIQSVALTFMAVLGAGIAQATSSRIDTGD